MRWSRVFAFSLPHSENRTHVRPDVLKNVDWHRSADTYELFLSDSTATDIRLYRLEKNDETIGWRYSPSVPFTTRPLFRLLSADSLVLEGGGGARIEGVEWDDCYKLLSDQTRNWTTVLRERTEGTIKPLQRNGSAFESSPPAITSVHAKTRVGEGAFTVLGIILGRPIASYNI